MTYLHLAFEKSADSLLKKLVKVFAGPYVHVEMIITQTLYDNSVSGRPPILQHASYSAYMSETFSRTLQKDFWFDDQCHDFLSVSVTPEELYRINKTLEACVESKIPYNTSDMLLSQVPLRNPTDRDIYESKTLFCSQAAVLVLRSCLDEDHVLQAPLAGINSRTITPSKLHEVLASFCLPKLKPHIFSQ